MHIACIRECPHFRAEGNSERCSSECNTFNTLGQRWPMNPKIITMKQRNSIHHTRIKRSSIQAFLRKPWSCFLCVSTVFIEITSDFGSAVSSSVHFRRGEKRFRVQKRNLGGYEKNSCLECGRSGRCAFRNKKTISFFKWGFHWFLIYDYLNAIFCPQIVCQSDMMYKISHVV